MSPGTGAVNPCVVGTGCGHRGTGGDSSKHGTARAPSANRFSNILLNNFKFFKKFWI